MKYFLSVFVLLTLFSSNIHSEPCSIKQKTSFREFLLNNKSKACYCTDDTKDCGTLNCCKLNEKIDAMLLNDYEAMSIDCEISLAFCYQEYDLLMDLVVKHKKPQAETYTVEKLKDLDFIVLEYVEASDIEPSCANNFGFLWISHEECQDVFLKNPGAN